MIPLELTLMIPLGLTLMIPSELTPSFPALPRAALTYKQKKTPTENMFSSKSFSFVCDPVGIQTQDLQNRNLTLYSAKLRDLCANLNAKVRH